MTAPQHPHTFACTWYSVTRGGGGGAMSNSCSFCAQLLQRGFRRVIGHKSP